MIAFTIYKLVASTRLINVLADVYRKIIPAGIAILFLVGMVVQELTFVYPWNIKAAAQYLQNNLKNEDIIYVPSERVLWGLCWYLIGPRSINPRLSRGTIIQQNGFRVITKPMIENPIIGQNYWLIFQTTDSIAPFDKTQLSQLISFNDLIAAYVGK